MQVELITHTPDPLKVCVAAARRCYSNDSIYDLLEYKEPEKLLRKLLDWGHESVLEHASFTFAIEGISRACTQQVQRHRLASYAQQSQRYVVEDTGCMGVTLPESVDRNHNATMIWDHVIRTVEEGYEALIQTGIPAEDARGILPMNIHSSFVMTMNVRELRHFFKLRMCRQAQQEVQELAYNMHALVVPVFPEAFAAVRPPCDSCKRKHKNCL